MNKLHKKFKYFLLPLILSGGVVYFTSLNCGLKLPCDVSDPECSPLGVYSLLNGNLFAGNDTPPTTAISVAGFTITPATSTLITSESGTTASFTIVLNKAPTGNVTVPVSSSDTSEGLVSTALLTFTTSNWDNAQTVTVTGVDDAITDGNIVYHVILGTTSSSDPSYNNKDLPDISVMNADNETGGIPGITVFPVSGLVTTENGGTASFAVWLNSMPAANVTIGITSSNTAEGTVSPSSLTFNSTNWATPVQVTVTGVNDFVADGSAGYSIITAPASSTDTNYAGMDPANVTVTNTDNDTPGVSITPTSGLVVNESGTTAVFTIKLNSQPEAGKQVQIDFTSSNPAEGIVTPAFYIFDESNWNTLKNITITGQNDNATDGSILYSVNSTINLAGTSDPDYTGIGGLPSVSVTTADNETPGISVTPVSNNTDETGTMASIKVVLNSDPGATVTIPLSSSDTTEGIVSTTSLVFTGGSCPGAGNWCSDQIVTVTGIDDFFQDGNIVYAIIMQQSSSANPLYNNIIIPNINITNADDDTAGITLFDPGAPGLTVSEAGQTDQFDLRLNSQPNTGTTVRIPLSVPNTHQEVSLDNLTWTNSLNVDFTSMNWFIARTVYVRSVQDTSMDRAPSAGQPSFTLSMSPAIVLGGTDMNYNGRVVTPVSSLAGVNREDERYIFISTAAHNGAFDIDPMLAAGVNDAVNGDANPVPELDNFCMNEAAGKGYTGTFKAMISVTGIRVATIISDSGNLQKDWVMKGNTTYTRTADLVNILTTNTKALAVWPVTNSFTTSAATTWTGLLAGWNTSGQTCTNWTTASAVGTGSTGNALMTDSTAIASGPSACDIPQRVICVEQ